MSNSVLITGGLGYIGGRISEALYLSGYQVFCGTRRAINSHPDWLPQEIRIIHLEWDSMESLENACHGIKYVIHLAASNEVESASDPIAAFEMNSLGTLRLLEAAKKQGVQRFLYFSTAHIYGAPLQGNIDETTLPKPVHPYAITHKAAEDFVLAAQQNREIEGVVFRLSNGFGAPKTTRIDRWTLLVNDLCRQLVATRVLRLKTLGDQLRDFITLEDVGLAVKHILKVDKELLLDGLFNLGGSNTMSIYEMAQKIAACGSALTGWDVRIIRPQGNSEIQPHFKYICDKLKSTGYKGLSQIDREIEGTLSLCQRDFLER